MKRVTVFCLAFALGIAGIAFSQDDYADAKAAYTKRDYSNAIVLLSQAAKTTYDNTKLWAIYRLEAECFFQTGEYHLAYQLYTSLQRYENGADESARLGFRKALCLFYQKDYRAALSELINCYSSSLYHPEILYLCGVCQLELGGATDAADFFKRVIKDYPSAPIIASAYLSLAKIYYDNRQYEISIRIYDKVRQAYPNFQSDPSLDYREGLCYYRLEQYEKAEKCFSLMMRLKSSPFHSGALYYSALIRLKAHDAKQAANRLEAILTDCSDSEYAADARSKLGNLRFENGQYQAAIETVMPLLRQLPQKPEQLYEDALIIAVDASYRLNSCQDALSLMDNWEKSGNPLTAELVYRKALIYRTLNDIQLSDTYFGICIAKYGSTPEGSKSLYQRGINCEMAKKPEQAADLYNLYLLSKPSQQETQKTEGRLAALYEKLTNYNKAVAANLVLMENASTTDVRDSAYRSLIRLYIKLNQPEDAAALIKAFIEKYPKSKLIALSYFTLGVIEYNRKQSDEAKNYFLKIVSDYPDSEYFGEALMNTGRIYYKQERFESGKEWLKPYLNSVSDKQIKTGLLTITGWYQFRLKEYADAAASFKSAAQLTDDSATKINLYIAVAKSTENQGKPLEAIDQYKKLYTVTTNRSIKAMILSDLYRLCTSVEDTSFAETAFRTLTNDFPESDIAAETVFLKAENCFNSGYYPQAIELFARYIRSYPNKPLTEPAYYWTAWCYLNQNDRPKAVEAFEKYLAKYPSGETAATALLKLGEIYYSLNNIARSRQYYQSLIERFPESGDADRSKLALWELTEKEKSGYNEEKLYRNWIDQAKTPEAKAAGMLKLSEYLIAKERLPEAVELLREIAQTTKSAEAAMAAYQLGAIAEKSGEPDEAIEWYLKIFTEYKYGVYYPQTLYAIAECYIGKGEKQTAAKYLERIIENYPDTEWAKKASMLKAGN